jgi:hypothetical protein
MRSKLLLANAVCLLLLTCMALTVAVAGPKNGTVTVRMLPPVDGSAVPAEATLGAPTARPLAAASPIPATIEQRDAIRVQAIVSEPGCPKCTGPQALVPNNVPLAPLDGVTPVQDREACLFLPAYCGPLLCAPLDDWLAGGRFYVMADLIALKRDQSGSVPFATLNNQPVLSTEQRDIPFRYGMRFLTGVSLSPWTRIEGLYLGLTDWIDSAGVRNDSPNVLGGDGNLFSRLSNFGNPPIPGIDYNTRAELYYRSILDNVELNWRQRLPAPAWLEASFIFGARYISVREQFQLSTKSEVPGPLGAQNQVNTGSGNDLIGAQIGGTVNAPIHDAWWIELELKGALCQNNAAQTTVYTQDAFGGVDTSTSSKRATSTAFVGDLSLSLLCQCTDHIAVRFGYQAIWIDGLALASENVPTDVNVLTRGPAQLVDDGHVVYHGPHAGLMLSW